MWRILFELILLMKIFDFPPCHLSAKERHLFIFDGLSVVFWRS
jgi:hypothetical protein